VLVVQEIKLLEPMVLTLFLVLLRLRVVVVVVLLSQQLTQV
jgi:hypothetical protein